MWTLNSRQAENLMNANSFPPSFFVGVCGAFKLGAKARMNSKPIVWVSLFLTVAFTSTGLADPLRINVLETQYTNSVSISGPTIEGDRWVMTNYSRTTVSPVPISDALYHPISGLPQAEAYAGPFEISAFTAPNIDHPDYVYYNAYASGASKIWFSPLASETTTINMQFLGWEDQSYYSGGSVRLFDVTSGSELWNYEWNGTLGGTVPWVLPGGAPLMTATVTVDTAFDAANVYELTLYTWTDSQEPERASMVIQLSGLEPLPEPSTFALFGLGSLALTMGRRRRVA